MSNIEYTGLGFPIILENPKMIEVFGEMLPDVNKKDLQDKVFKALLNSEDRLSGAQIRFVRQKMGLTQSQLAKQLQVSNHSSVSQWESADSKGSGMELGLEKLLRILMEDFVGENRSHQKWIHRSINKSVLLGKPRVNLASKRKSVKKAA
jgi:DNA-binding transcriptional regulator YiaG